MTTTPTPTGKIRGSLQDVMPKLRNFTGAVKVSTPKGKGGLLVESGRLVASYLTHDGVLHRGKDSIDILDREPLSEFEILRYDDEQFREARIICDNRGLLLGDEKGVTPAAPPGAREGKAGVERSEETTLLSSMMKRFAPPKPTAKQEAARAAKKTGAEQVPVPAVPPVAPPAEAPAAGLPAPRPPATGEAGILPGEKKEAPKEAPAPAPEADLAAIIRRLRESERTGKGTSSPMAKPGEPAAQIPGAAPGKKPEPMEEAPPREEGPEAPAGERRAAISPPGDGETGAPMAGEPGGRVKVDLGQMMKRIKRLDITSIRRELEEGEAEGKPAGATLETTAPALPAGEAALAEAPSPGTGEAGKSDIDELKAFIRKLEVMEGPKEPPSSGTGLLGKIGVKAPGGDTVSPEPKPETPAPVPGKAKPAVEPAPAEPEKPAAAEVPPEKPPAGAPRAAEPDRKAKIASLLRRSGLVKPPAEEQPVEIIAGQPAVSKPLPGVENAPAPAAEPEIPAQKPARKKVEITLVPKKPEKPPREPPLIDEKAIQKILKQPGVIAVSTFFEGFAVQSAGRADFEQVAANAEDLFRAGTKIAREIDIGPLNQIILETGKGKLIIAPHGDLNVCIFTEPEANLGLIRVALRSLQVEKT